MEIQPFHNYNSSSLHSVNPPPPILARRGGGGGGGGGGEWKISNLKLGNFQNNWRKPLVGGEGDKK